VHYAYHPCEDALLSVHEYIGKGWKLQDSKRVMREKIAPRGVDALGVLLMGYALNVYLLVRFDSEYRRGSASCPIQHGY
jgi:homospermidine synthase